MRRLIVLACVLGVAGLLASVAAACHSEISATLDCNGMVSYSATAWNGSDATTVSRTNSDVRVYASYDDGAHFTQVGSGHFGSDNNFAFAGTFSAGAATKVIVAVKEVANWGNGDAPAQAQTVTLTRSSSCSETPVCPSADKDKVTMTQPITLANGSASVKFKIAAGCKDIELSLVSYKAPGPTFDEQTADQQTVFDYKTQTFSAGDYTLSVLVPDCYYQIDFVRGTVITKLGPAGTDNFYDKQGRLIDAASGGTAACVTTTPPGGGTPSTPAVPSVPAPSISLVKLERLGSTGDYVAGPLTGKVGQTVNYKLTVTNTGAATVTVTLQDNGCDGLAPVGTQSLAPGASIDFTCSHTLASSDGSSYTNVAVATATATSGAQASATSNVVAQVAQGAVLGTTTKKAAPKAKAKSKVKKIVKHKKVKKVTKKAKPARAVVRGAHFTG
jgi:hypothetical protein